MRPQPPGLSDEKIDMVQNFLDTIPNAMHFEHLDGFFCALISGPELVPSSEYLPFIFGGEMPRFQSVGQGEEIMRALEEHWKHIDDTLAKRTDYYPFLFADQDDKCSANDWADAFMLGVQLRKASWDDLLENTSEEGLLTQIIALRNELTEIIDGKSELISGDERESMVKQLVVNLQEIYQHYAEQRGKNKPPPQH